MKLFYYLLLVNLIKPAFGLAQDDQFQIKYENPTKQLGIGLLKLDYYERPIIEIFNDPDFSSEYAQWNSEGPNMEIYPKFYELDYGICDFVCLEVAATYCKILIGYNQAKYVKVSNSWSLTSWQDLIENSYGVTRKRDMRESNRLRVSNSDDSREIPLELKTHENFCVISLKDIWINVKYDCVYATDQYREFEGQPCSEYIDKCGNDKVGWIKWKQNGDLLIQIYVRS